MLSANALSVIHAATADLHNTPIAREPRANASTDLNRNIHAHTSVARIVRIRVRLSNYCVNFSPASSRGRPAACVFRSTSNWVVSRNLSGSRANASISTSMIFKT